MTEAEWLACDDPAAMQPLVTEEGARRKQALFSVACLRRVWHLVTDERSRALLESEEAYLDGLASEEDAARFFDAFEPAYVNGELGNEGGDEIDHAVYDLVHVGWEYAFSAANRIARALGDLAEDDDDGLAWEVAYRSERAAQTRLLRDVVGNPFRPVTLAPAHRTPAVASLAQAAYDERQLPSGELDPHRLAVLADALEEAGAPGELVAHLRKPGPHYRGCFAVDLVLGLN